jgi:predicted kinase
MTRPTLILLNGPAGIGKTTIAQRYIDEHPLALSVSNDALVVMLGQWLRHEPEAWEMVFNFTCDMARRHLRAGHDVILPYLVREGAQAEAFAQIAQECGVTYVEVLLTASKQEAVERMLERGTWGEGGAPPLTEADVPIIEQLYDMVHKNLDEKPHIAIIQSVRGDIDGTYAEFLKHVTKA